MHNHAWCVKSLCKNYFVCGKPTYTCTQLMTNIDGITYHSRCSAATDSDHATCPTHAQFLSASTHPQSISGSTISRAYQM